MTTSSGLVTVLFTDVVGSTEIGSTIGDVAADELRRQHFADLAAAIDATGGTLVKTIGDAVMVTFSGAADALNCAVEMQRAVAFRNRRSEGHPIHIRIGVSAGDATFENGDWFGTPVVEASRLCAAAEGDQILVSDLVAALAGSRAGHEVTSAGTRELKGLPTPIGVSEVAWRASEQADGSTPLPGFVDTDPTFGFAGRSEELELIRTNWKEAIEGRRRLVMISGEPGVGKTRLVTEFVRTAHADGAVVLWGRCDEEIEIPFQPFAEALQLYVAASDDDRLRAEIGPHAGELARLVPELAQRVSGIAAVPTGDADADRARLFDAVAGAFRAIAERDAVVLVLDDLHWADRSSLVLLKYLLRQSRPIRLLMLGTYRDTDLDRSHPLSDVLADLRREQGVERVDLGGLDLAEITAFMELAAGHELDEPGIELAAAVHRETEGNPFFIGEMIRHLAEAGYIVERDGRWVSDYRLEDVGIPEGIREVVGRRLSSLSEQVNRVLSVAAVIGPEFDIATVQGVLDEPADAVLDALDDAVRASVIREVAGTFGRYAFAHALVRSTLYEELSTNRRVRWHWKVGTALQHRFGRSQDHIDSIAHHLVEGALAGDPEAAVEACRAAAERAADDLAFDGAARWYERAIGALELATADDLDRQFAVEFGLAESLRLAGDADQRSAGLAAVHTARRLDDAERFAQAVATMDMATPPTQLDDEVVSLVREAIAVLGDDASPLGVRLRLMLITLTYWHGDPAERTALGAATLEMARATNDPAALSAALGRDWALLDYTKPNLAQTLATSQEALAISQPATAPHVQALENLTALSAASGETDRALDYLAQLTHEARATNIGGYVFRSMVMSSMLAVHLGDLERAEAEATDMLAYAIDRGMGDQGTGSFGAVLMYIRRAQGRSDEAVPVLVNLVETQPELPVWRIALAGCCYFSGDLDLLREHFEWLTADDIARVPRDVEFPVTICGLARVASRAEAAPELCERLYDILRPFAGSMNYTGTSISDANDIGLACAAELLGRHDVADGHFGDAIALADRARALPFSLHYRYEWARALSGRGDSARARPLVAEVVERSAGRGMDGPNGYVRWSRDLLAEIDARPG